MTLDVYFRQDRAATLSPGAGGKVAITGPQAQSVAKIAAFYARQSGLKGEQLLALLAKRLSGNWWAKESGQ